MLICVCGHDYTAHEGGACFYSYNCDCALYRQRDYTPHPSYRNQLPPERRCETCKHSTPYSKHIRQCSLVEAGRRLDSFVELTGVCDFYEIQSN